MKSIAILTAAAAALAAFLPAAAADKTRDSVVKLLDARSGGGRRVYEEAAREVAEEAAEGQPLHQFLTAIISKEPGAPKAARLADEVRERYLEQNRSRIRVLAQKNDNPLAWYLLYLDTGNQNFLKRAADGDDPHALNELGAKRLFNSDGSLASDRVARECFSCFGRAAAKNDPNGLYNLGVCCKNGWGHRKDEALALEHLRRAADMDHPQAVNLLGEMYRDGGILERNAETATKYFSQSAAAGFPGGQYNYAKALFAGEGVEKNEPRAVALMKAAAESGMLEAMDEYAGYLYAGAGGETNRQHEAFALWRYCAEEREFPVSMDNLATCYRDGVGVGQNTSWAVAWYTRSAKKGYVPAMRHLADCYDMGLGGLKKSHYAANWWRTRARAAEGDRLARAWLAEHRLERQ